MKFKALSFLLSLLPLGNAVLGQVPIGSWRDHLPYDKAIKVTHGTKRVFAATPYGVISYNTDDNSIRRVTKINDLNGTNISTIRFDKENQGLLVGYENGMMDLLKGDDTRNIPDIQNSGVLGNKRINDIYFHKGDAYLSCAFGIVVLDLDRIEISNSYIIGNNSTKKYIHQTVIFKDTIYAATESGFYKAPMNAPNLSDFNSWTYTTPRGLSGPFTDVVHFDNQLHLLYEGGSGNKDSIFTFDGSRWEPYAPLPASDPIKDLEVGSNTLVVTREDAVLYDRNGKQVKQIFDYVGSGNYVDMNHAIHWNDHVWVADENQGLVKAFNSWQSETIKPNGPLTNKSFAMKADDDHVWVATGRVGQSWNNNYNLEGILRFHDEEWLTFNPINVPRMDTLYDPITLAIDPDDASHVYFGTWGNGVMEFKDGKFKEHYTTANSSLQERVSSSSGEIMVGGMDYDSDGNLWMSNSYTNRGISVKTAGGDWKSFSFGSAISASNTLGPLITTEFDQKWVALPRDGGILVFQDNGTINDPSDDQFKMLNNTVGNGKLPSNSVLSLVEDQEGEVWVGTEEGIAVFYTPDDLFTNDPSDASEILVDKGGFLQPLLETEQITTIEVDGADRKWIGTNSSGVFLVSPDGKEQIRHFNENNSPLFSNQIQDIAIHPETGEVFIGTAEGILSYRGEATEGKQTMENITVYPNPVRTDYSGPIAIKGLPANSVVKIADVNGNLVYETESKGGQAIWDGTDTDGLRVSTGVYMIFCASPEGEQSAVAKIMFFN